MAVPLKAVHSTSAPKIIFPHFLTVEMVWKIIEKSNLLFSNFIFLLCYAPKLHFGRSEVADRDEKGRKILRFCEACSVP